MQRPLPLSGMSRHSRMPMPPPPAVLLSITGNPMLERFARSASAATGEQAAFRAAAARRSPPPCARAVCFSPNDAHLFRRRSDERDSGLLAGLGEGRVLAQESVAGMNRFGPGSPRRVQNLARHRDSFAPPAAGPSSTASVACSHAANAGPLRNRPRPTQRPCDRECG